MNNLYTVELDNGSRYQAQAPAELELKVGNYCIVRKDFYLDYARVIHRYPPAEEENTNSSLPRIERAATAADRETAAGNQERGKNAIATAYRFVELLKLEMKLLNAHYSFDCKQIVIQFTADGRVDFRELVKELSRALSARIDLRQIGVRDETSICGGIGICGQELCCRRFLKEFNSINVRMAKDQDLSLTPSTISGACGRLKCCLKFEHAGYLELEKGMPHRGEYCECPEGRGRIYDRNLLTQSVSVQLESGNLVHYTRDEITIVSQEKPRPPKPKKAPPEAAPRKDGRSDNAGRPPRNSGNRKAENNSEKQ